jgi:hypothetical protein
MDRTSALGYFRMDSGYKQLHCSLPFLHLNLQCSVFASPSVTMCTSSLASCCNPATFQYLTLFGAEFTSIEVNLVTGYDNDISEGWRFSQPSVLVQNVTFCNVTVSYTHPGENDNIYVETWLPTMNYKGRLQAVGGGGWVPGRFALTYAGMAGAVHDGYASVTTDAGLGLNYIPDSWALVSPGNVNLYNLQNFGSIALRDEVSSTHTFRGVGTCAKIQPRLSLSRTSSDSTTANCQRIRTGMAALKEAGRAPHSPSSIQQRLTASSRRPRRSILFGFQ